MQQGYHVLTPDLRGQGKSGGKLIGMGWPDRLDLLQWIHYLIERFGSEIQIVLPVPVAVPLPPSSLLPPP